MAESDGEHREFSLLGETIPVRYRGNEQLVERSLATVEQRIHQLQEQNPKASNLQLSLLATLNLAAELHRERETLRENELRDGTVEKLDNTHQRVLKLLESD